MLSLERRRFLEEELLSVRGAHAREIDDWKTYGKRLIRLIESLSSEREAMKATLEQERAKYGKLKHAYRSMRARVSRLEPERDYYEGLAMERGCESFLPLDYFPAASDSLSLSDDAVRGADSMEGSFFPQSECAKRCLTSTPENSDLERELSRLTRENRRLSSNFRSSQRSNAELRQELRILQSRLPASSDSRRPASSSAPAASAGRQQPVRRVVKLSDLKRAPATATH